VTDDYHRFVQGSQIFRDKQPTEGRTQSQHLEWTAIMVTSRITGASHSIANRKSQF
jgi:hypothetical protein